jgi:hypothetical protein
VASSRALHTVWQHCGREGERELIIIIIIDRERERERERESERVREREISLGTKQGVQGVVAPVTAASRCVPSTFGHFLIVTKLPSTTNNQIIPAPPAPPLHLLRDRSARRSSLRSSADFARCSFSSSARVRADMSPVTSPSPTALPPTAPRRTFSFTGPVLAASWWIDKG